MSTYTVVIRTVTGGPKYGELLNAISCQTVKPENVYVVLPIGQSYPSERLGSETFLFTEKGMWSQRIFGLEYPCSSDYLLVCDDDITFADDFVYNMIEMAKKYNADAIIPTKDNFQPFTTRLFSALTGGRIESNKSKYKISIRATGSFRVNNCLAGEANPTQSGPFACFLFKRNEIESLNLKDELWLDDAAYALPDDQVFYYKAFIRGKRLFATKKLSYVHLDNGSKSPKRSVNIAYSMGRNHHIFWHRFLYLPIKKRGNWFSIYHSYLSNKYRICGLCLIFWANSMRQKNMSILKAYIKGVKAANLFINSSEYKNLGDI